MEIIKLIIIIVIINPQMWFFLLSNNNFNDLSTTSSNINSIGCILWKKLSKNGFLLLVQINVITFYYFIKKIYKFFNNVIYY